MHSLNTNDFDLYDLLESIIIKYQIETLYKMKISFSFDPKVGKGFHGDNEKIEKIFDFIFRYFLGFSNNLKITLKVTLDANENISFQVINNSIGLNQIDEEKFYTLYHQVEFQLIENYIKQMNGHITLDNKLGSGALFDFSISLEKASNVQSDDFTIFVDKKVLVVSASDSWLEIIMHLLVTFGMDVSISKNTSHDLSIIKNKNIDYDLVLIDWNLSKEQSIDTYRLINSIFAIDFNKIVMFGSGVIENMSEDVEEACIEHYLQKPVDPKIFYELLHGLFTQDKPNTINTTVQEESSTTIISNKFDSITTFDTQYGLGLLMGDETIYLKMLYNVLQYKNIDFLALHEDELQVKLYSLDGLLVSIGAHDLSKKVFQIEEKMDKTLLNEFVSGFHELIDEIETKVID